MPDRKSARANVRYCMYCDGAGCEECDETGRKYRIAWEDEHGTTLSMTGSGFGPTPDEMLGMEMVARAAMQVAAPADEEEK